MHIFSPTSSKGAFLLANPDSDSHNPIFVSPFHLSESEIRFESKESTSNSGFFGFNFTPDSDSPFLYPFHRAHAQCSLGIHHGVQRIELHRYVLCCCLSLFSNEYFRGIEMKLVLISEISSSFIYSVPENNIMHLVVQVRPT